MIKKLVVRDMAHVEIDPNKAGSHLPSTPPCDSTPSFSLFGRPVSTSGKRLTML